MASDTKQFGVKIQGYIGNTEIKSIRKKDIIRFDDTDESATTTTNCKSTTDDEENDEEDQEMFYPETLLKVEVNESDEVISPPIFNEQPWAPNEKLVIQQDQRKRRLKPPAKPPKAKKPARIQKAQQPEQNTAEIEFVGVSNEPDLQNVKPERAKKEFRCDMCNMTFGKRLILRRHLLTHQGDIKCPICSIPFRNNINLGKHISSVHNKMKKCKKCHATFRTREELHAHNQENKHDMRAYSEDIYTDSSWCEKSDTSPTTDKNDLNYDIQTAIVSKMYKAVPMQDICRLYNVTSDVVNDIWNVRDKYILPSKIMRRNISYVNKMLEPPLLEWYYKEKKKDTYITGRMIQDTAEKIAKEKGFVHFTASPKWLERFKRRYSIYLTNARREYAKQQTESIWKVKFFEGRWQKIRPSYTDDEIYVADEVGLFYNPSKSRERKFAGKKYVQGEMEDRLSIFLCANMSGTDKRKMFVCGTEDPLRNSNKDPSTLPVDYKRHSQCHFTTDMFEEYVMNWNDVLRKRKKKALLLLDRASIHTKLDLSHLQLEFLPWKALNTLMPIRNGVFAKLRAEFRNLLLQFKTMNVIKEQDRNLTCFEALQMLVKAWDRTPPHVITKSFLDLGFEVRNIKESTEPSTLDADNEKLCAFLKDYDVEPYFTDINSLDMYLSVDEQLLCGKGTKPSVFGGNHKVIDKPVLANQDPGEELPLNTGMPISNEMESIIRNTRELADLVIVKQKLQGYDSNVIDSLKFKM